MSVYKYPQSNVIDEVTFKRTANGSVRAYLHAQPNVSPDRVHDILDTFDKNGWQALPFNLDGKPTLEIRGLKNEATFLSFLKSHHWVSGAVSHHEEKGERLSLMEKFKNRTLQASGVAMGIADLGFIGYGLIEANNHKKRGIHTKRDFREALAGLSYLTGSTVLTAYGRNDQSDIQIREIAKLVLQRAEEKGLTVNDSAAENISEDKNKGTLSQLNNFFRKHPSEIGNMSYFAAGAFIGGSALQNRALAKPRPGMTEKQIREMRKGGWGDAALGGTTMASGLVATLGKERAPDPNAPPKHGVAAKFDHIKRSPLAIAGIGYIASTLCHTYTTFIERKEALRAIADSTLKPLERDIAKDKMKAIPFRVTFISFTLIGELLLTISSKGHGHGVQVDDTVDQSIYSVTADLISRQPKALQADLIKNMSEFLSDPKVLGGDRGKIAQELTADVELMRKNPWAVAASAAQQAAPAQPQQLVMQQQEKPCPTKACKFKKDPAWSARIAAEEPATEHLRS